MESEWLLPLPKVEPLPPPEVVSERLPPPPKVEPVPPPEVESEWSPPPPPDVLSDRLPPPPPEVESERRPELESEKRPSWLLSGWPASSQSVWQQVRRWLGPRQPHKRGFLALRFSRQSNLRFGGGVVSLM